VVENYFPVLGYYDHWDSKSYRSEEKAEGFTTEKKFRTTCPKEVYFSKYFFKQNLPIKAKLSKNHAN
jgi:hypothetical protein